MRLLDWPQLQKLFNFYYLNLLFILNCSKNLGFKKSTTYNFFKSILLQTATIKTTLISNKLL